MDTTQQNTLRELIHDARNPLNVISMNAELALLLNSSGKGEKLEASLNTIVAQSAELDKLLTSISDFIKTSADKN